MESILKSDVFFFITSVSTILFTIVFLIAMFYFIKILRNFYKISSILKNLSENADTELRDMGHHIRQSPLFTFLFGKEKENKEKENPKRKSI
ncbi:MAG TPA: hypothetical protein VK153_00840 [Candidatus Paceibacterota bacterium]|nr:hypothetical protein [Candidatus Paceibacterota bacterium]